MIKFSCHCKHLFTVSDDMAGGLVQCPKCGRLNDVPLLSDVPNLDPDGTYTLDADPLPTPGDVLPKMKRAFAKDKIDETTGEEFDLRQTIEDIDAIPLADEQEPPQELPKYDPATGELIRPIDVKQQDHVNPASIPMAATVIGYASRDTLRTQTPLRILLELFQPANVAVMFFVFCAHLLVNAVAFLCLCATLAGGFSVLGAIMTFVLIPALMAHYANTIEEIGPDGADELPRPLRSLSWWEDVWNPFINCGLALLYAYAPWLITVFFGEHIIRFVGPGTWLLLFWVLLPIGTVLFPAILLTAITSGSVLNLRMDRVFGVIRACGWWYLLALFSFMVGMTLYVGGILASNFMGAFLMFMPAGAVRGGWIYWGLTYGMMIAGIYLMHFFAWQMGLLYRHNHDKFPWVLQRFIPQPKPVRGPKPRPQSTTPAPRKPARQGPAR